MKGVVVITVSLISLMCAGCKKRPEQTEKSVIQPGVGSMKILKTDLPLAKQEWNPEPPEPSSQAFMVPDGTRLLSRGAKVTSSDEMPITGDLTMITDGNVKQKYSYHVELLDGLQWVQIDLEKSYAIQAVLVWHYYMPDFVEFDYQAAGEAPYLARVYQDVVVQISEDSKFEQGVTTIYNSDHDNSSGLGQGEDVTYIETREGRWIAAKGVKGRYVRLYSSGHLLLYGGKDKIPEYRSYLDSNDYVEVEVYGE